MANYDSDVKLSVGLDAQDVKDTANSLEEDIREIFEKAGSSDNLSSSFKSLQTSMDKALQKSKDIQAKMQELEGTTTATPVYAEYEKALERLDAKLKSVGARMAKFLELNTKEGVTTDDLKQTKTHKSMQYDYDKIYEQIQKIHEQMRSIRAEGEAFMPSVDTTVYQNLVDKLNQVNNQLTIYRERAYSAGEIDFSAPATGINRIIESIKNAISSIRAFVSGVAQAASNIPVLSAGLKLLGTGLIKIVGALKNAVVAAAKLYANLLKTVGSGIISGFKKLGSAISNLGKHAKSSSGGFEKGFKSFIRYGLGVRSIFALVNKLRRALFEGFGDLAQVHEPFNRAMSSMMTALNQLKNSFAAAFAPIIETVAPILTTFINKMSQAVTMVGQFIAALTGKEFVKANVVQKDYAESVAGSAASANKAAKATGKQAKESEKLKKTLAGFDDVEILKGPDEDSSSSTPDTGDTGGGGGIAFSTAPIESSIKGFADKIKEAWLNADFYDIGRIVGTKIRDALENIPWTEIQDVLNRIAKSIATFLNGFLETPGLFEAIGKTLAKALNTAFLGLNTFVQTFHWSSLGKAIGTGLNSAMTLINWKLIQSTARNVASGLVSTLNTAIKTVNWSLAGYTYAQKINTVIAFFHTAVKEFKWADAGASLGRFINNAIQNINWAELGQTISEAIKGLLTYFNSAVQEIDWEEFGSNVGTALKEIDWAGICQLFFEAIGSVIGGLGAFLWGLIKEEWAKVQRWWKGVAYSDGQFTIQGLLDGILQKLKDIGTWIKENIFEPFVSGVKKAFGIESPSKEMKPIGENIINGLFGGILEKLRDVKTWIATNIVDPFVNGVKDLFGLDGHESKLFTIGGQLIDGLKSGITSKLEDAGDWIDKNVTGPIKGFFESGFGINNNTSEDSYEYGSSFIGGLDSGMTDNIDTPVGTLSTLEGNMENVFVSPLESWKTAGKNLLEKGIKPGLESFGGKVKSSVESLEANLRGVFRANKDNWKTEGSDRIDDFRAGLEEKTSDAKDTMQGVLDDVSGTIDDSEAMFNEDGGNVISYIDSGLSDPEDILSSTANSLAGGIGDEFDNYNFDTVGSNIGTGIYNGLIDELEDLKTLAWNTAVAMYNEACAALGIASPSKKFAWIGKMTMNGLAGGIEDNSGNVLDTVSNISTAMEEEAEKANPTITLTDSVDDWIGKLDDVLTTFGNAVTDKFDALVNSMNVLANYDIPDIAHGKVVPATALVTQETNNDFTDLQQRIDSLADDVVTRSYLREMMSDVIRAIGEINFYIGDEQIARHSQRGSMKLNRRFNTSM